MKGAIAKILIVSCFALPLIAAVPDDGYTNLLDVETPNFFQYNSPLRQPDSLRSRPYFDFLSTLYRRDATKADLFRPYVRQRRDAAAAEVPTPVVAAAADAVPATPVGQPERAKRAILFRPLFVYRQQMIKKQELAKKKRKRV